MVRQLAEQPIRRRDGILQLDTDIRRSRRSGYPHPPPPAYGYPPVKPPKKNKFGLRLGDGLLGGALGGMLIGDAISDTKLIH
nr:protein SRC2-like [Ipomoea trifida]